MQTVFYSLLIVVAIAIGLLLQRKGRNLPKGEQRAQLRKIALWLGVGLIVVLALTGRAHWLMGVIAGLIGVASRALQLANFIPAFKRVFGSLNDEEKPTQNSQADSKTRSNKMSRLDAANLLGVELDATKEEIKQAHKRLMQKVHPDRGGTDELAAQLNRAKDVLLG
ncbi:MAG: DnaJ domain-containing protein [Gammaproteobacteria bacterium]|nr:DnaJ domain-containing protein [Gammaproteobacteria bacterium]